MRHESVNILTDTVTKDATGRDIKTWTVNSTFVGSFQPVNYAVGFKPYGVTDKTSNAFYCKDRNLIQKYFLPKGDPNQLNVTCRLGIYNNQYIIDSILPFPNHIEIYVELVI